MVVPAVAEDEASTPVKSVSVIGSKTHLKDIEHDLGGDRHAGGARTFGVSLHTLQLAPSITSQTKAMTKSRVCQSKVFLSLVDGSLVWIEGALGNEASVDEVLHGQQDSMLRGRQETARTLNIKFRQSDSAKVNKVLPLTGVTLFGAGV